MQGKYVVLFFYPLDFTFVCPTEITAFSDKHDQFKKLNAEVTISVHVTAMRLMLEQHKDASLNLMSFGKICDCRFWASLWTHSSLIWHGARQVGACMLPN